MKFNQNSKGSNTVVNYEGASAYRLTPEWQLYVSVVTSLLSDKYYETTSDRLETLRCLISKNDPQFVARLAIYAREQMNLRSIPLVLAVELAKVHSGDALVQKMVARIVQRADEITELLAYYQMANQRTETKKLNRLSKQLQAGLQIAFNNFDEYQFAKYNRQTEIKLRDALFLVHPKAKDDVQQTIFNKIADDTLQTPYTWETELSDLGQNQFDTEEAKNEAFARKWEELIDSGKLGYMALLRNLRNILLSDVSQNHINRVCEIISNKNKVLKSKQLPFRFLAAYRELSEIVSGKIDKMKVVFENEAMAIVENSITHRDLLESISGTTRKLMNVMEETVKTTEKLTSYKNLLTSRSGQNSIVINALDEVVKAADETFATYRELLKIKSSTTGLLLEALEKSMIASNENLAAYRKLLESMSGHNGIVFEALEEAVKTAVENLETYRELLEIKLNNTGKVIDAQEEAKKSAVQKMATYRGLLENISGTTSKVMDALENAVKASAGNIAGFNETTKVLVACDVSGSMQRPISPNSSIMNYDIGLMLGMLLKSRCENVVSGIFGSTWKIVDLPDSGVLSNVNEFYKREGGVGYATNGYLVVQDLIDKNETMDKIMIFTDCQMWDSSGNHTQFKNVWKKYKTIAPDAKLYLFDLAGYGNVPLNITGDDVHLIAGWSDKIFDILQAIDNGNDALKVINEIEF